MNNLVYTITNHGFQFKSQLFKQHRNNFQWNNAESQGHVHCGELLQGLIHNVMEFHAHDSLALNHHPKNADGFLFIINQLSTSGYVQLMTESNLMVDYAPRNVEVYAIAADKLFSFTYAPATTGKRIEFFVKTDVLWSTFSPSLIQMLRHKPFLPFSELLNETLYQEVCRQLDSLFSHNTIGAHTNIIFSLLSILKNFNDFADKTTLLNPLFPYKATVNAERQYGSYKNIA